jgi:two-component system, chemotaxis family, CheB/CheR fusion protein
MPKKRVSKSESESRQVSTAKAKRPTHPASPRKTRTAVKAESGDVLGDSSPDAEILDFFIVGVGASAGGFEAFIPLISDLPEDTGMAFVLVQHLDPKHESQLSELLSRATSLPLREAQNGMPIQPNHIYVIPPNVNMTLESGRLRLQPRKPGFPHMPVDVFLRSLAAAQQNRAIGIILSGTGTDGTLGMEAVKGEGGITFAQDEKSAKFFGMPGSTISAGSADMVLPPVGIARELVRIARHPYLGQPPKEARRKSHPSSAMAASEGLFLEKEDYLQTLFSLLRSRTSVDFSLYKHSTLRRRILRRMLLHKIDNLSAYVDYLRVHVVEMDALFNDLLINVTGFFRDPRVFETLKRRIIPKLLKHRFNDSALRIWVCGCSSGEEAYSMAMTVTEIFETSRTRVNAQIFATDISEVSLEKARAGVYPENIALDVSPERLRRFFVKTNGKYQVSKAIRDMCVFARQNLVVDPPFSNVDLISCRNVLIYLGPLLQKKIMPVFHYALKPSGFLLLGASEAIGSVSDLFSLVDKKHKLYSKKVGTDRPGFILSRARAHDNKPEPSRPEAGGFHPQVKAMDLQQYVDRLILSKWSPAAVVVNGQMDALLFRGQTGKYLEHAPGSASLNLLKMVRESLVLDLRTAMANAIKHDAPVKQESASLLADEQLRFVTIEVVPFQLTPSSERLFLILFKDGPSNAALAEVESRGASTNVKDRRDSDRREITKLRQELALSRESHQSIIEEQEATNEELKSANEEIQSSNEELQSTNEELETAKEELQSTNEELTTLNEELQTRNLELSQSNNDLTNLLASVNVAIIMLSNDLTIRRFTPMAERMFNLIPSDVGRRLSDLNRNIVMPDLDASIREVVDSLSSVEREVQDKDGRWYSLRIRPYRTRENKIDGAVILLVDIDEQKRAVELLMSTVKQPLISLYPDLRVKRANDAFYKTFQASADETENHYIYDLGKGHWNIPRLRTLLEHTLTKQQQVDDFEVEAEFPVLGRRKMRLDARSYAEDGKGTKLILLAIKDLSIQ